MTILQNGALMTPEGPLNADLRMDGGKIAEIAPHIRPGGGEDVVDASGCWVCPGFIDGHTHLDLDTGATRTADDFASGTRAAVCGTTTICDFATQDRGDTMAHALEVWHGLADGVPSCNYAFHMAVTDWNERTKAELPALRAAGVTSFKAYFAYDNLRLDDGAILELLESIRPFGGVLGVHCENGDVVERLRRRGQTVYAETCPQYLLLDDSRYRLPGFEGAKYVMSPPLRGREDVRALREAVVNGEIDTISTDHCDFNFAGQKELGRGDFTKIPNGAPGIEHRPALMFTSFSGALSPSRLCGLLSANQARLFGMYPRKGALAVGSDADVVVWDPRARWTITAADQRQRVDYTPYEGMEMEGRARLVYVNGVLAARNGQPTGAVAGEYIKR